MDHIEILSVPIHRLTRQEAGEAFIDLAKGKSQHICATPNAEILLESEKDPELKSILQSATLNFADSVSLLWAGEAAYNRQQTANSKRWIFTSLLELIFLPIRKYFWKHTFPETVTGSDLYLSICEKASQQGKSVFLLGGQGIVPEVNATNLKTRFPELEIAGYLEGDPATEADEATVKIINNSSADILFVAFGCPRQEKWIARNLESLTSVKVAIGIGGSFDFVAGLIKRAPSWMQKCGLEWLWRLLLQPARIQRIWKAVVVFPRVILKKQNNRTTE